VDRLTGALAGLATGLVVATLLWGLMLAAGSPIGGSSTPMQVSLRAATSASVFGRTAAKPLLPPFQAAFAPVLPRDPQQYFGSATT
jgi:hypothetical protein